MKFKPMPIIRFYVRYVVLALTAGMFAMAFLPFMVLDDPFTFVYSFIIFTLGMPVLWCYCLHKELWEKIFATIFISSDEIVWRCPFRKARRLPTSKCYIGVEKENAHNGGDYPYIYFALKPYPRALAHKIDKLPCSDEFVKYRYDSDIAEYILKTLPKLQTKRLEYFRYMYNRKR